MSARSRLYCHAAAFVLMATVSSGCDDLRPMTITARGVAGPSFVPSAFVIPSTLPFQVLPAVGCPFVSPFASSFTLAIDAGGVDLLLHQVGFQFVDSWGFTSPLILNRADLTGLFGTTVIGAGRRRAFDFQPHFGCGFAGRPHRMSATLVLLDPAGARLDQRVEARLLGGKP